MSLELHKNKSKYFDQQRENAAKYVIPFIQEKVKISKETRVLEIGCAEGGVLNAFLNLGCFGDGIELSPARAKLARQNLSTFVSEGKARVINENIYDIEVERDLGNKYDLIILKDVIEHIHDQSKFMARIGDFLADNGHIFFGFPPWQMPFGGHQQICDSKFLGLLPYYHLLPMPAYKGFLKFFGETDKQIEVLREIKETGISLGQFEKICAKNHFEIVHKTLYLINPIYQFKFGLKPRKQLPLIGSIPYVRNFVTSCGYYLVKKR